MKKLILIPSSILAFMVLFSCGKENTSPTLPNIAAQANQNHPIFSEENSRAIAWNELPANLKRAESLEAPTTPDNARAFSISTLGPWGGNGGTGFSITPTDSADRIYAIAIRSDKHIDALTVWYQRADSSIYSFSKGGNGGTFYIQYFDGDEYIQAMGGRTTNFVNLLTIYSNKKTFSYGMQKGKSFYAAAACNSRILGFFGRSGDFINEIGGYAYSF